MLTARERPEWIGKKPESMPTIHVALRILERQGGRCACGCQKEIDLDRDQVDRDHIKPLRDGGENRESNLQLLLRDCHKPKTVAENIARGEERRHKAKAFKSLKKRKPGGFQANRDGKFKKKMDGTVVPRERKR